MSTPDTISDGMRVLLVEDNPQALNLTKRMLATAGVTQILTAGDGKEALEVLDTPDAEEAVDVVLCDWNMPVMNGLELLKHVRADDQELMFIMITGQADKSSVIEAKSEGINGFIKKPFSQEELVKKLNVVSRVIAHRKLN